MALVQFSGLASGIDSTALIEALLDQERQAKVDPYETKISEYQDQNDAFSEVKTLLNSLKSVSESFRLINGGAIAKEAISSDETVATATASNSATAGAFSLSVAQVASNGILSFDDRYNTTSEAIYSGMNDGDSAANRTVSFSVGSGADQEDVNVVLTSNSTLDDLVAQFNVNSTQANASTVNMGTDSAPSYAILITSNETGLAEGQVGVSVGSAVTDGGAGAFNSTTIDQARNAEFSIDGISGTITRTSNTVNDVVAGLTFNLESVGNSTITVANDAATTTSTIEDFVNAYNDVLEFIKENDTVEREENGEEVNNIFGALAKSSLDDNILSALRSALTSSGISGGEVNILADLGITTERDGTLKFDAEVFEEALNNDPTSISSILEKMGENLGATDGTIAQFVQFNGLIDLSLREGDSLISNLNDQISTAEKLLAQKEASLTARFARLEAIMADMQSQQTTLTSILPT